MKLRQTWDRIRPSPRTVRFISLSSFFVALVLGGFLGVRLHTGWGTLADVGIGVGIPLGLMLLSIPALGFLRLLLVQLPKSFGRLGVAAFLVMTWLLDSSGFTLGQAAVASGAIVVMMALLFGALASITDGEPTGMFKRLWVATCGLAGLVGIGWGVLWLTQAGDTAHLVPALADPHPPVEISAGDPSAIGKHQVIVTSYGSGVDHHRNAFGEGVRIKTEPFNAKPYASFPSGWSLHRRLAWNRGCNKVCGRN